MALLSSRNLSIASRYIRWVLAIALTVSVVIIVAREIIAMTNQYDINIFSKEKLNSEQYSTDFYNYVLVFAIFITLISTVLLIFHNGRLSKLKDLQLQQVENSQAESALKTAQVSLDLEKQKKENLQLKIKLEETQQRASEAKDIASKANEGVKETKSKIKPRHLTDKQKEDFIELLKNVPHQSVGFEYISGDMESH